MAQTQEELLERQDHIVFLLQVSSLKDNYKHFLHLKITQNEDDEFTKVLDADNIRIDEVLKSIKTYYYLYKNAELDETQETIKKEVLVLISKLMYLFDL
ncbi:hypothetical protein [Sulfolobus super-elliptical virus]|nr:hypothetical protein [Sulfolobus super-elliptical virus]